MQQCFRGLVIFHMQWPIVCVFIVCICNGLLHGKMPLSSKDTGTILLLLFTIKYVDSIPNVFDYYW